MLHAWHRFLADSARNFGCCKIILILHWHIMFTLAVYLKKNYDAEERGNEWMAATATPITSPTQFTKLETFSPIKLIASYSSAIALFVAGSSFNFVFFHLPMVDINVVLNASSEKRNKMQVFPTPLSPISNNLKR